MTFMTSGTSLFGVEAFSYGDSRAPFNVIGDLLSYNRLNVAQLNGTPILSCDYSSSCTSGGVSEAVQLEWARAHENERAMFGWCQKFSP